jgi:Na+/proline symporter
MPISPDVLRALLILSHLGMATLALLFLRTRALSLAEYIMWGLLAFLAPFLGPILVIFLKPGQKQKRKT